MISWLQSFFDNFSDFERINIFLIIIIIVSIIGGWALSNFE
jgi:hypothetical protein